MIFETVREGADFVVRHSQHVKINQEKIEEIVHLLDSAQEPQIIKHILGTSQKMTFEQKLAFVLLFQSTNFCLWKDPGFRQALTRRANEGGLFIAKCYRQAYRAGFDLCDPNMVSNATYTTYQDVLKKGRDDGFVLSKKRFDALKKVMTVLKEKYEGSVQKLIEVAEENAETLLTILVKEFPGFSDVSSFKDRSIPFLKRAARVVADLEHVYCEKTGKTLKNIEKMTAAVGYKVPQLLRHLGVLEYSEELAKTIHKGIHIPSGDSREIEIRGNTVAAVDRITEAYNRRHSDKPKTSKNVDEVLWILSQNNWKDIEPHHKTVTWVY